MNWITIQEAHYNLDQIIWFCWDYKNKKLVILHVGDELADMYDDPERVWYNKLCSRVSLLPVNGGAEDA